MKSSKSFQIYLSSVFSLFVVLSEAQSWNKANLHTLKLVQIIMRHGDRNPVWSFPKDPHKDDPTYWVGGFQQLTDRGVKQTHEVGKFVRARYDGFLSSKYLEEEIYAMSSDKDRSIRSGQSFLRGLYPKTKEHLTEISSEYQLHDDGEESQVVPIRTTPLKTDNYIYIGDVECPRQKILEDLHLFNSVEMKEIERTNKSVLEIISNNTGLKGTRLKDLGIAFDYLNCQRFQNKTVLPWATPEMMDFIDKFMVFILGGETKTNEMKSMRSGIVKTVVQNMKDKLETTRKAALVDATPKDKKRSKRKMMFYSGHDRTVITFLNILNLYNHLPSPYATAVLIELHSRPGLDDHVVEIYYRNDSSVEPYKLEIPNCRGRCALQTFVKIAENYIPKDYDKVCKASSADNFGGSSTLMAIMLNLLFLVSITKQHY